MTEPEWLAGTDPEPMFAFLSWERSGREARWAPRYGPRQARLFACACCRRIWDLLAEERLQGAVAFARRTRRLFSARQWQGIAQSGRLDWVEADPPLSPSSGRRAVEVAERFADGLCGRAELDEAARSAEAFYHPWPFYDAAYRRSWGPYECDQAATALAAFAACKASDHLITLGLPALYASGAVAYARGLGKLGEDATYAQRTDPAENAAHCDLLRDILGSPFRPAAFEPAWRMPEAMALARAAYEHRDLPSGILDPARLAVLADALEEAGCTASEVLGHLRSPGPHFRGCWSLDLVLGRE